MNKKYIITIITIIIFIIALSVVLYFMFKHSTKSKKNSKWKYTNWTAKKVRFSDNDTDINPCSSTGDCDNMTEYNRVATCVEVTPDGKQTPTDDANCSDIKKESIKEICGCKNTTYCKCSGICSQNLCLNPLVDGDKLGKPIQLKIGDKYLTFDKPVKNMNPIKISADIKNTFNSFQVDSDNYITILTDDKDTYYLSALGVNDNNKVYAYTQQANKWYKTDNGILISRSEIKMANYYLIVNNDNTISTVNFDRISEIPNDAISVDIVYTPSTYEWAYTDWSKIN